MEKENETKKGMGGKRMNDGDGSSRLGGAVVEGTEGIKVVRGAKKMWEKGDHQMVSGRKKTNPDTLDGKKRARR